MGRNILNVGHNYYIGGGSDAYMIYLTHLLEKYGNTVVPFAGKSRRNLPSKWECYYPKTWEDEQSKLRQAIAYYYSFEAKAQLRNLVKAYGREFDVAHLHIFYGKLTNSILDVLQENNIPVVQTLHEYKLICPVYTMERNGEACEECGGRDFWKAIKYKCKNSSFVQSAIRASEAYFSRALGDVSKIDHFIAVSDFIRDKMVVHGIESERITVIHNFVDTERFLPRSGIPKDYFVYFGRVEKNKGIYTLLEAARRGGHRLIVVGTGGELEAAIRFCDDKNMKNVEFTGFRSGLELECLVKGARASIIPSEWYENCPMSVLESMAWGVPVIGTKIGGIPELVADEVDGLLVEIRDPEGLSRAMDKLSDPQKSVEYGRRARRKVEDRFAPEAHYGKLASIYDRVIRRKRYP